MAFRRPTVRSRSAPPEIPGASGDTRKPFFSWACPLCPNERIVGIMRSHAMVGLVAMSLILASCAGADYRISADRLKYPTSLSPVLADGQGKPLYLGEDLQPVGEFSFNRTSVVCF